MKSRKRGRPAADSSDKPAAKKAAINSPAQGKTRATSKTVQKPTVKKTVVIKKVSAPARSKKSKQTETSRVNQKKHAPNKKKTLPIKFSGAMGKSSGEESAERRDQKKQDEATTELLLSETSVEMEDEHNYSKDPRDELMKLNLLIYACPVCKKYSFDPQQMTNHARTAHEGKVGVMLMLPLPDVNLPKLASPQKQQVLASPPPTRVVSPAAEGNKTMYRCDKCDRQFDRARQMNMHRCLQMNRRKSSPRRGEESTLSKSPSRAEEMLTLMTPKENKKESESETVTSHLVIVENEATNTDKIKESGVEDGKKIPPIPPKTATDLVDTESPQQFGDSPTKVRSFDEDPMDNGIDDDGDDDDDGIPPTLGVHLSKDIPPEDRAGTWKLCKRKHVTGWKWEAQKVSDEEMKQIAEQENEKREMDMIEKAKNEKEKSKMERNKEDSEKVEGEKEESKKEEDEKESGKEESKEDKSIEENSEAEETHNQIDKIGSQVNIPSTVLGEDDDYEFCEDDYVEDNDDDEPVPFIHNPEVGKKIDPDSLIGKYQALSDILDDDMMKQWANKDPPTVDELSKYIKKVHGGLQSPNGEALDFFMCLICRKVFKTKNVMTPHIFSHIGYRPYMCVQCGYSSTHKRGWTTHIQKHNDNELKCWHGQCVYVGKDAEDLDEHRKTHAPSLRCILCDVKFKGQSTMLGHLYISHREEIREGKGKEFYTLMATAGRAKSQIVLFECDICGQKCKTKKSYYTHIRMNHAPQSGSKKAKGRKNKNGEKKKRKRVKKRSSSRNCPMCGMAFEGEVKLTRHLNTHPFIYRCSMCEEKFLTYGALNEHVGFHRADQEGEFNPQDKINESLRRSIYLAGQMDKALEADKVQWAQRRTGAEAPKSAMTGSIFDDLMSKISIPTEIVSKEELEEVGEDFVNLNYKKLTPSILRYIHLRFGNVECGVCGKLFPKVGLCKDHTKKHTKVKDCKCPHCDFQGKNKKALESHLARVHNEGESFHCPKCDTNIIGAELYKHHMRRHAKEDSGPYTCTWCNTVEGKREDMKNHIMNTHPMMPLAESTKILGQGVVIHREKGAPFLVCEVCNETFRRICDLRRHMWKHSSVKRFTCDLCDYGSDKRGNIISHMRKHSTEKQAACHVCGKMYKTMQSLKLHVQTAHLKLKPHKCDLCDYAAAQPVHLRRHVVLHHNTGERRRFRCAICPDYRATDLQVVKRHYQKKHPNQKMNLSKCCPPDAFNPSTMKKDKHQVIQVVPSVPSLNETPAVNHDTPMLPESTQEMDHEQVNQSNEMDPAIVEVQTEQHQEIPQDMTVEVILPEDQGQLIDINSSLPDVINALASLQDSEIISQ
ncbi:PR domain zinc finger protein 15-like [Lytechinus pictus]|uniref:PR domain zinc finger protein 15-like n=1 Tax=Lytechinus pictus TaxID=7653 RepID=UPI0030B9B90A